MLKPILLANAASCLGFGAVMAAFPTSTSNFLGSPPVWLLVVIGIGLIANGLNLIWVARKHAPIPSEIMQFVIGDAIWVLATLFLVGTGIWITTSAGILAALLIGVWVAVCGLGQYVHRAERSAR